MKLEKNVDKDIVKFLIVSSKKVWKDLIYKTKTVLRMLFLIVNILFKQVW